LRCSSSWQSWFLICSNKRPGNMDKALHLQSSLKILLAMFMSSLKDFVRPHCTLWSDQC
jgi:hypothetical protein